MDYYSECDSPATVEAIAGALRSGGHEVHFVEADRDLPRWLATHSVDIVFNIAEGFDGAHRESQTPALLEWLGIPYTGSSAVTLALALDKAKTKRLLQYEGIPTPAFQLFDTDGEPLQPHLRFPLIVKPNREGSAKGIGVESVVRDEASLRAQVRRVLAAYRQAALVEEFIDGVELTVGVLDDGAPRALPVLEIDFSSCRGSGEYFYSWRMKEFQGDASQGLVPHLHCPARLTPETTARVQELAVRAHRALGCDDVSRTDIRLRPDGAAFVLEVNPLPGLDPFDSNLPFIAKGAGLSYPQLINGILASAVDRHLARATGLAGHVAAGTSVWSREQGPPHMPACVGSPRVDGARHVMPPAVMVAE